MSDSKPRVGMRKRQDVPQSEPEGTGDPIIEAFMGSNGDRASRRHAGMSFGDDGRGAYQAQRTMRPTVYSHGAPHDDDEDLSPYAMPSSSYEEDLISNGIDFGDDTARMGAWRGRREAAEKAPEEDTIQNNVHVDPGAQREIREEADVIRSEIRRLSREAAMIGASGARRSPQNARRLQSLDNRISDYQKRYGRLLIEYQRAGGGDLGMLEPYEAPVMTEDEYMENTARERRKAELSGRSSGMHDGYEMALAESRADAKRRDMELAAACSVILVLCVVIVLLVIMR